MPKALVIKSTGSWYSVYDTIADKEILCRLRGKIKLEGRKTTNPIAVGDTVDYEIEEEEKGIISQIYPRRNYLIRRSVHRAHESHVIAANVDQLLLIASLTLPKTSLGFIDRLLVTAEAYDVPAILVLNKFDLLDAQDQELVFGIQALYQSIGYQVMVVSAETGYGMEPFRKSLEGKMTLLAGHSGVGKSTLANKIDPSLDLRTQEVSSFANKGVHTTTFAQIHAIGGFSQATGYLVDTPGIKELGLVDIGKEELSHYFPEMRAMLNQCRFDNCLHLREPGCAVRDAVDAGTISELRYASYLSMMEDDDTFR